MKTSIIPPYQVNNTNVKINDEKHMISWTPTLQFSHIGILFLSSSTECFILINFSSCILK